MEGNVNAFFFLTGTHRHSNFVIQEMGEIDDFIYSHFTCEDFNLHKSFE